MPAADGALDVSFGNYLSGISMITFGDGSVGDRPSSVLVQPDGKLVIVGTASYSLDAHVAMTIAALVPRERPGLR